MTAAITCRDIVMRFQEGDESHLVLDNITLDIDPGRLTMIAGPSGCGKTTLLSILGGALKPTSGDVCVFGEHLAKLSGGAMARFRRSHVGFIFQQYNLVPALTAVENAAMPLIIAGTPAHQAFKAARRELARLGLEKYADRLPKKLSGGQQQRVAIARALTHGPRLVICDEPTAALDSKSGEAVMAILGDLSKDESRAVLVVTHDQRVFSFADRLIELEDGRVRADEDMVAIRGLGANGEDGASPHDEAA
ncbi:MAG: ABC transporter ATP-binding protein [Pseudomonadota bacterium]